MSVTKKILPALTLGAATLAVPALADDDLFFSELPVVASVSRLPQRLADAPTSVTVIDREMIRASGARALNDLLRLVPGFQTFAHSDTPARVTYHGVTDHDTSPRVQVLVDGRSLHSPLFENGMNWGMVPVALEDIERIEVVRGTNTVSYGTNAFLGVINIITVDPSLVRGTSVSMANGSQGVRDYTVRAGGSFGVGGNVRLTVQQVQDNGLEDNYDWRDSFRNRRFDLRADYQLGVRDVVELGLGRVEGRFTSGRYGCGPRVRPNPQPCGPQFGLDEDDPIRNLEQSSTWMQARWLRTLTADSDFSLRYTYTRDDGDNTFTDPNLDAPLSRVNWAGKRGLRHELEGIYTFSPVDRTRMVVGASVRHDALLSPTLMYGRGWESRQVARAFANGEWKPSPWFTGNLGLSSEHDSLAGDHLSPRASAAFHLTPENTVRIGYSRAWRTGSILAYRANHRVSMDDSNPESIEYQGNPDLKAERLDSWELAYLGDWRDWRMSLDLRVFREKLTDRMMSVRSGGIFLGGEDYLDFPNQEQSIQDIRIRGYEFQWKWRPLDDTRLILGHANLRIDSEWSSNGQRLSTIPNSNLYDLDPLEDDWTKYVSLANDSAPRRSTSLMLMQKLPFGIDFSIARYIVRGMQWTRNTTVDGYHRTDARLAYRFKLGGQRGELAYTVQSLNGSHIEERKSDDEPKERVVDRRHWISLRLDF